jgi:para-nitrobenzyl esterase
MAEIPFVFHNIDKSAATIGDSEEARALEERMSRAWVNFAGTGDPNTDNLPEWPSFDRESGATMLFDNEPMVGYHHDRKLLTLLAPEYQY